MQKASFRDILASFLEEESPIQAKDSADQGGKNLHLDPVQEVEHSLFLLNWQQKQRSHSTAGRSRQFVYPFVYQSASTPTRLKPTVAPHPAPPPTVEPTFSADTLTVSEALHLQTLVELGATELKASLSASGLKQAHRRLAKRFHPDRTTWDQGLSATHSAVAFRRLQSAYEGLRAALARLTSV